MTKDTDQELKKWQESERKLSAAYVRLRVLIPGALDTPHAPTSEQVWETTERALVGMRAKIIEECAQAAEKLDPDGLKCVGGHDRCFLGFPDEECPYCEKHSPIAAAIRKLA